MIHDWDHKMRRLLPSGRAVSVSFENHSALGLTFKENAGVEAQQTMDDLDDFERRLAGGPAVSKAAVSRAPPPMRAPAAPKAGAKKGSEYVKASRAAKSEEEQDAEDARNAVSDLDKFDQKFGY